MDDSELIRRAKRGEIVASGERAVEALCRRLATMEAAVRAADRLTDASTESPYGIFRTYGPKELAVVEMQADYEALGAAVKLLEDSNDT